MIFGKEFGPGIRDGANDPETAETRPIWVPTTRRGDALALQLERLLVPLVHSLLLLLLFSKCCGRVCSLIIVVSTRTTCRERLYPARQRIGHVSSYACRRHAHVFVAASLSVRTNVHRVAVAFGDLWGIDISRVCKRTTAIVISTGVTWCARA